MPTWTPGNWGDFSVAGIVVFMAILFYWSLITGRIVTGKNHAEVVDGKNEVIASRDAAIERLTARSGKDVDTINMLSATITKTAATEDATTRILTSLREAVRSGER